MNGKWTNSARLSSLLYCILLKRHFFSLAFVCKLVIVYADKMELPQRSRTERQNHKICFWRHSGSSLFPPGHMVESFGFIAVIDNIQPPCEILKYVDDTTVNKIFVSKILQSQIDEFGSKREQFVSPKLFESPQFT